MYRKSWRSHLFSKNTLKKGLLRVPSSPSSSSPLRVSSCLPAVPPSSGMTAASFWKVTELRLCVCRRGDTALRVWVLLDSLLRRESLEGGLTFEGDAEDMALDRAPGRPFADQQKGVGKKIPGFKVRILGSKVTDMQRRYLHGVLGVRSVDGEDSLSLRFQLKGREHHFLRSKQEPVGKALKRIVTSLSKHDKGKKKNGASPDTLEFAKSVSMEAHIYTGGLEGKMEISPTTTNQEAWVSYNTFVVDDTTFAIALNTPTVKYLRLPGRVMTGCATVPLVELEFADAGQCRWVWRRCDSSEALLDLAPVFPSNGGATASPVSQPLSSVCREAISACPVVSTSLVYWATEEDCHHSFILECIPCNSDGEEGRVVVVASKSVVSSVLNIPMAERHLFTPSHLSEPDQFRIVSYNILADVYASSEHARQTLYPYCDAHALDQEYRQCLIVRELLGYRADIVSLQEVGAKCFSQFLSPALHHWGYEGCFHAKAGKVYTVCGCGCVRVWVCVCMHVGVHALLTASIPYCVLCRLLKERLFSSTAQSSHWYLRRRWL